MGRGQAFPSSSQGSLELHHVRYGVIALGFGGYHTGLCHIFWLVGKVDGGHCRKDEGSPIPARGKKAGSRYRDNDDGAAVPRLSWS